MSLLDIIRAVRRHLVVVVLLLIASGAAAYGVYSQVPVYYQSDATMVVLLPSVARGVDDQLVPVNPWTNLGAQSSQVAASALASVAASEDFETSLIDEGVTSDVTVEVAPNYGGGVVLTLNAVSLQASAAQQDLVSVSALVSAALAARQVGAGAPEGTLLTVTDLTSATSPAALATSGIKVAGATVIIGIVVTVVVVLLLEGLRSRRPRPAASEAPTGAPETRPDASGPTLDARQERQETAEPNHNDWLDADLWTDSKPLVSQNR
ncbi:MAG: hypothetical protein H0T46_16530 [Deltaproteobacteria bacterium]|nr:hypothetical protein [Deltaproteobacteria bacterium]